MTNNKNPIDFQLIRDMLYDDEAYVDEFCEASVTSFKEFRDNFKQSLQDEDIEMLRRTGHKIKPVAKMLKLNPILEIYEDSKAMLDDGVEMERKEKYINKMDDYCNKILEQLKERAES